jgi:spore coat polysaccharide biosynthesis protein SpsF
MRPLAGRPLLGHLLDRVRRVRGLDGLVVATSADRENDPIEEFCGAEGVACFRGAEDDVLGRMIGALDMLQADVGVEAYGDGPLIDPLLVEECLTTFLEEGSWDLVGNDLVATYPSGMYTEAFSVAALRDAAQRTQDIAVREHGTLFLRQHRDLYRVRNIEAQGPLRRPDLHLEVDTEEDLVLVEAILQHFTPREDFALHEIIAFLDAHPALAGSNQHVERRWKQYQQP